jgi:hypothetical protein
LHDQQVGEVSRFADRRDVRYLASPETALGKC